MSPEALELRFDSNDCAALGRYPNSVAWNEVSEPDRDRFKRIRSKLKILATELASARAVAVPLRGGVSLATPNGRSPREIWSCVYPASVPNKSYGLQVALIVSARGAEVCFCMGKGDSQIADPAKKADLRRAFDVARAKLSSIPQEVRASVEERRKERWSYRRSWLTEPNKTDFESLEDWLKYAGGPDGSG